MKKANLREKLSYAHAKTHRGDDTSASTTEVNMNMAREVSKKFRKNMVLSWEGGKSRNPGGIVILKV